MRFVYILQSISHPKEWYVGLCEDIEHRLALHNQGRSPHTKKFLPWQLVTYLAFSDPEKAMVFEKYLKSGSGRAFAKKRLR